MSPRLTQVLVVFAGLVLIGFGAIDHGTDSTVETCTAVILFAISFVLGEMGEWRKL